MTVALLFETDLEHQIITSLRTWLGTPYLHQASVKGVGCDCLGLVRGVWRDVYKCEPELTPPYTPDWAESGQQEQLANAASRHMKLVDNKRFQSGDLLIFRWRKHLPAKHLAIVSSLTTMIHAQEGVAVCEVAISPWWKRHIAYVFRFPETPIFMKTSSKQKGKSI